MGGGGGGGGGLGGGPFVEGVLFDCSTYRTDLVVLTMRTRLFEVKLRQATR